jgi:glucokinase
MDVGGTNLRFALVRDGADGVEIVRRDSVLTGDEEGRDAVMDRIVEATNTAMGWSDARPVGVGMAMAGPTDPVTGVMFRPPNIMSFDGFSPMAALTERLGVNAVSANDATMAALAEHRYGGHGKSDNLVYLTLSTGVGGGQVVNGDLYTGAGGFAGEWGHVTIDPNGPPCNCGNRGDLESFCSGPSVTRMAIHMIEQSSQQSPLRQIAPEALTPKGIELIARDGDALARTIYEEAGRYLGISVAGILAAVDPDIVVVGGGVSNALDLMIPGVERELAWRAMEQHRGRMPVVRATLGDDSALLGAAALALQAFG